MTGKLAHYLQSLSTLRTDKNRNRWSAATCFRAPHKSFLLLSIFDLIASGSITENFIEPSFELAETFAGYWSLVMAPGTSGSMSYPFYHLGTSGFWHLQPQPGFSHKRGRTISSVKRLRELYLGARFDDDLFHLLIMEESREILRKILITTFFAPEVQPVVTRQGLINRDAAQYSAHLLAAAEPMPAYVTASETDEQTRCRVRDQGFRRAIVTLYEHRCAMCGIRMRTPEGHTIVEAAHIVPWSRSHNDRPQNGMALCRLCHWSFDKGLMGVGKEYEVLISPAVRRNNNFPGHMETLSGRGIFKPGDATFWPDQEYLQIHRKERFRRISH
ncbi:HNH endonuclease [Desulfolithobacter dissulfuricans]|uniref:HNH endonuclease n=1 Tax=Desulfolithobacter dissulfuricans TaxID=2795293 RepID=A0A915U216_9BACT|nr:HNH endonuclease [Desulfolithobacter dissulfuricans]BCO09899.1 HNH endonuclease [Desulfolithobacter dissulfuricans]